MDDGRQREHALLVVAWRPLWQQLQATFASHQHENARGASGLTRSRLQALVGLARRSARFFAPGAAAEVAAAVAPSLLHSTTVAMFSAAVMLHLFLPNCACVADFAPGTVEGWLRTWSLVDHCGEWDALWARIFLRLAHPEALCDVDRYEEAGGAGGAGGALARRRTGQRRKRPAVADD